MCELLITNVSTERCRSCDQYRYNNVYLSFYSIIVFYRANLFSLVSKAKEYRPITSSSHINIRYLSALELKDRTTELQHTKKCLQLKISALKEKMAKSVENEGIILDEGISSDFKKIMNDEDKQVTESLLPDSFKSIFWQQQKEALRRKSNGQRWHPLIIRWCLYLRHQSSKCYDTLRDSGCILLPSQRTLRDYSHCVKAGSGYSTEEDRQLMRAANICSCPDWHKLIILLVDEIHIKESIVYDKHSGRMVGFVDLGDVNNHLSAFERRVESNSQAESVAKSMVAVMVRGLFTPLRFPYTQFPCSSVTGEMLFQPFWEAVYRLERIGFKVK